MTEAGVRLLVLAEGLLGIRLNSRASKVPVYRRKGSLLGKRKRGGNDLLLKLNLLSQWPRTHRPLWIIRRRRRRVVGSILPLLWLLLRSQHHPLLLCLKLLRLIVKVVVISLTKALILVRIQGLSGGIPCCRTHKLLLRLRLLPDLR